MILIVFTACFCILAFILFSKMRFAKEHVDDVAQPRAVHQFILYKQLDKTIAWIAKKIKIKDLSIYKKLLSEADIEVIPPLHYFIYQIMIAICVCAFGVICFLPRHAIIFITIITIGAIYPYFVLRSAGLRRIKQIKMELPYFFDLLALGVEGGMDFASALIRTADHFKKTPLASELRRILRSIESGKMRWQAVSEMSGRIALKPVKRFAAAVAHSDRLGVGLASPLKCLAKSIREERFVKAEKAGVMASYKIMIPTVLCIMPSTFVIIFGPMFIRLVTHGLNGLIYG